MLETLQAWDEALLLLLNGTPAWMGPAAWGLSSLWAVIPVVVLILWSLFRRFPVRRALLGLLALILTFAGTDAISSRLMKPGFERLRPSREPRLEGLLILHEHADGSVYRGGRFGFVSSHAANTFGLATCAVLLFGASAWRWLWLWAALISWSRVYLGVHYTGDIVFGALFGAVFAAAITWATLRLSTLIPRP